MKVTLVRGRAIDPAVNKVAKALAQNGYEVKLLVWDRQNTLRNKNVDGYTIYKFNFRAPYDKFIAIFYLPFWWIYEFFFLMRDNCNVIHACDLDTLIPAIFIKLIKKVKLCYIIYDFYANNLPDGKFALVRRAIRSLVAFVERFGIRFTEVLFLVDESRYEEVKGARINKLVYIYNSPPDHFKTKPMPESEIISDITIFYAGVIHKSRGLEYMIKAVKEMDKVKLIIAGIGPDRKIIEEASRQDEKIQYIGQIPYDEVLKKTLEADVLFAFYDPSIPNNRHASPNKLFEAMMCGKPIIVSDDSSMAEIVRRERCGIFVPYGDVEAITKALGKFKANLCHYKQLGKNGRRAYEEKYSWDIMESRLINVYEALYDEALTGRIKKNLNGVCLVVFPVTESFVKPLSNLKKILYHFSCKLYTISGILDNIIIHRESWSYPIQYRKGKSPFSRIAIYIYLQIRISLILLKLSRHIAVCVFFLEGGAAPCMLIAKLLRKKIIWVLPSSLTKIANYHKDFLSLWLFCLQKLSYALVDKIILYSPSLIEEWNLGKYCHKISTAHEHLIDFDKFRIEKQLTERSNLIGYIGRLSKEKGILNFMEAIPLLIEDEDNVKILVGGDGQLRTNVEHILSKENLNNKVRFIGWILHDELPKYLNALKLLVLPSYTEGLPNIMLEAMACGTPVLATAVGAIPDVIRDEETGFILEDNSPESIANGIIRALDYPHLEQVAANARALVEREFTFEAAVERWRKILADVL